MRDLQTRRFAIRVGSEDSGQFPCIQYVSDTCLHLSEVVDLTRGIANGYYGTLEDAFSALEILPELFLMAFRRYS